MGQSAGTGDANRKPVIAGETTPERRLHLYPQQAFAVLGEEIVGEVIAVWLGNADAVAGSAVHERQLGQLSHALAAEAAGRDIALRDLKVAPVAELFGIGEKKKARKKIRAFSAT